MPPTAHSPRPTSCGGAAGVAADPPIAAYDQLTASQIRSRLGHLNKAELRKVRTLEKRGKGRKSILDAIEKRLAELAPPRSGRRLQR